MRRVGCSGDPDATNAIARSPLRKSSDAPHVCACCSAPRSICPWWRHDRWSNGSVLVDSSVCLKAQ